MNINTDKLSDHYREKSINLDEKKVLVAKLGGSKQEADLTIPANCRGFGRIRHFRRATSEGWPSNPLPIDPAVKALSLGDTDIIKAQVYQNAACNWRCWYCYVPYSLLGASEKYAEFLTTAELISLYCDQPEPPPIIDLTGGQPDLVPEWVPWIMQELRSRGLEEKVYLWSDDNLSIDYFWRHLSDKDRELVASYRNYGRVGCFKGFDDASFAFNTHAAPELFDRQFELMKKLLKTNIDLYAYATFTTPSTKGIVDSMKRFVDKLQNLDENLPLRTVPLEIQVFGTVATRLNDIRSTSISNQQKVIEAWNLELEERFSSEQLSRNIADVTLQKY